MLQPSPSLHDLCVAGGGEGGKYARRIQVDIQLTGPLLAVLRPSASECALEIADIGRNVAVHIGVDSVASAQNLLLPHHCSKKHDREEGDESGIPHPGSSRS